MRAIGRWRVLGHVRRGAGSSERVCTRAIDVVHVFHGGTVRFAEKHSIAGAAIVDGMVQLQRKEKGEKKRGEAWASEADGGGCTH